MASKAGGIIRLTCGGIGTGKSYLNVKNVEEIKKQNKYKKIYSNIRSHSDLAEGVSLLPDDWRECEYDSLIVIDEIQMHEKFSKHFSSRRDSEIADLSMIRHKRIDIWMISPNPALVNSDVRNLVNQYVWLEIMSEKVTKGWCFTKVYNTVNKTLKNTAYDEFTYTIEEKYYTLYESTADGEASGRNSVINYKLIGFIVGMVFVVLLAAALYFMLVKSTKTKVDTMSTKADNQQQQAYDVNPLHSTKPSLTIPPDKVDFECRKAENLNVPQCIEWFNNLTKSGGSASNVTLVTYNPNKPYDLEDVDKKITYEVVNKPKFSGCAKYDGHYYAYTEQGTLLDVSAVDCQNLLNKASSRPYDYFANRKSEVHADNGVSNAPNSELILDAKL
jgi:zona occludens toxin